MDTRNGTTGVNAIRVSGSNVYQNDNGNVLTDSRSQNVGGIILATAEAAANNDLAGQLDVNALMKKIEEMTDPGKKAGAITLDYKKKKFFEEIGKLKKAKGAGSLVPGRYGPFQMTGYDYEDLKLNGYGTPDFDPTKLQEYTLQSILEGLPFVQ